MRPKLPLRQTKGAGFPAAHVHAESVPRPISSLQDSLQRGAVIPPHSHQRAQLIFAIRGTMTVRASRGLWILPPSHALWVPPGVVHQIDVSAAVEMRTLYVQRSHAQGISSECHVLFVSPLLRELIVRAMELPVLYDEHGMEGRLMTLILDEVARLPAQPLGLRLPRDARLLRLCDIVLRDLGTTDSVARLGAAVGLSERSVMRLFPKETGLSFRRWQNQAKLLKAFELLEQGQTLTQIALDVGYSGASAFAKMCRRTLGKPPTAMRAIG
jgi:AraC-like DNA-binding protein